MTCMYKYYNAISYVCESSKIVGRRHTYLVLTIPIWKKFPFASSRTLEPEENATSSFRKSLKVSEEMFDFSSNNFRQFSGQIFVRFLIDKQIDFLKTF